MKFKVAIIVFKNGDHVHFRNVTIDKNDKEVIQFKYENSDFNHLSGTATFYHGTFSGVLLMGN